MAHGRNRKYFSISLSISFIPIVGSVLSYLNHQHTLTVVLVALSVTCLVISVGLFISYKLVKHGTPLAVQLLVEWSRLIAPIVRWIATVPVVGPIVGGVVRVAFFLWFTGLLMSEVVLRSILRLWVGTHTSGRPYSLINFMNTNFALFDDDISTPLALRDSRVFEKTKQQQLGPDLWERYPEISDIKRPKYSLSLAYTLGVTSKLVYEDVAIIKYELAKAGFDVERTFRPVVYKNLCAFIVEKNDDIVLVFRGTNPLNIQNYVTNINHRLTNMVSPHYGDMGRLHSGFYEALGDPPSLKRPDGSTSTPQDSNLTIQITSTSLRKLISSAIKAGAKIIHFVAINVKRFVREPVDQRWVGSEVDVYREGAYAQAEDILMSMVQHAVAVSEKRRGARRRSDDPAGFETDEGYVAHTEDDYESRAERKRAEEAMDENKSLGRAVVGVARRAFRDDEDTDENWEESPTLSERRKRITSPDRPRTPLYCRRETDDAHKNTDERTAESAILEQKRMWCRKSKKRLFITGHSLGAASGTIFLAKMLQSNSPLLELFAGLYTYGHPKVGNEAFARVFGRSLSSRIFHHVLNNDVVPRVPWWGEFSTIPGTLVFIDSSREITIYPPHPRTNRPVPPRPISYLHLSGILNRKIAQRMAHETWARIVLRLALPFFFNDHFPGDYCDSLGEGHVKWVVMGNDGVFGGYTPQECDVEVYDVVVGGECEKQDVRRQTRRRRRQESNVQVEVRIDVSRVRF